MPTIRLASLQLGPLMFVLPPPGGRASVPATQLRCLVQLPQFLMPLDGVIDTGAPHTCFPKSIWERFVEGIDYEWLPFDVPLQPPVGQMVGWRYTFRMAQFLAPLRLTDLATTVERPDVIAAFADGDPPRRGNAPPVFSVGLWGGILEGGQIAVRRDATNRAVGDLVFP